MYCHLCGNKLSEDAVFCNRCGGKVLVTGPEPPSRRITGQFSGSTQPTMPAGVPIQPQQPSGATWYQPTMPAGVPIQPQYPFGTRSSQPLQTQVVAAPMPAPTAMQLLLIRIFQPALASNAWFGIILGGILAGFAGPLLAVLLLAIAHVIVPDHPISSSIVQSSHDIADFLLGINIPTHSLLRDGMQLFLAAQGVQIQTSGINSASVDSASVSLSRPLNGLLLLPGLLLMLGGYIAASTDFQNRPESSLWRGAAIAVPYTILLFLISTQVNGSIPLNNPSTSLTVNATLNVDGVTLIIFGLLWGALFGVLGASLKLAHGQWRHMLFQYLLRSNRHPLLAGMITGGLAATGLGIALSLLVLYSLAAYLLSSVSSATPGSSPVESIGGWQTIVLAAISLGPLLAANLFSFSSGAPITSTCNNAFIGTGASQNLCSNAIISLPTLSLFGGATLNGTTHPLPWFSYALLAIPVISLFLGGRVSAAMGRAQGAGPSAVQGALIAVPFTLLMMLLTVISAITLSASGMSSTAGSFSFQLSIGIKAFDLLLWALLGSAVFGALGGVYQTSALKTGVSQVLSGIVTLLELLGKPLYLLLDRLTEHPRFSPRSPARSLLYGAVFCALSLVVVAGVVGAMLIALSQIISPDANYRIRDILTGLLIALPGLFLLCASASALSRDPLERQSSVPAPTAPSTQFGGGG